MSEHHCHVERVDKPVDEAALQTAQAAYLAVSGMGCPNCAARVHNSLVALDGVLLAEVQLEMQVAAVAYQPEKVSPDDLAAAVARAGNDGHHHYAAQVIRVLPVHEALRP